MPPLKNFLIFKNKLLGYTTFEFLSKAVWLPSHWKIKKNKFVQFFNQKSAELFQPEFIKLPATVIEMDRLDDNMVPR